MNSTADLLDRLRRHYLKPGVDPAGGVFVPEVGLNNAGGQRRCDAVYVGFTSTSGRLLVGHELKVSRADWRHELDSPGKADLWSNACHAWYVVAPSVEVVPVEELPPGWGLLIPSTRSKNRMEVVRRSAEKPPSHDPPWMIVRSIIARLDTLQGQERWQAQRNARDAAEKIADERIDVLLRSRRASMSGDAEIVDELERTLGVRLRPSGRGALPYVSPDRLAEALALLSDSHRLEGYTGFSGVASSARQFADLLDGAAERARKAGVVER